MMHWCLQSNLYNEDAFIRLKESLIKFDCSYSEHKVIPFISELEPDLNLDHKNVICIGTYAMRHIAKKKGWNPGVFDLEELTYIDLIKNWGEKMLNYDAIFTKFGLANEIMNIGDDIRFLRPIVDSKVFTGTTMSGNEFQEWYNKVINLKEEDGSTINFNTEIMIAEPKNIAREYRFVVVNGDIITGSMYKLGDRVHYSSTIDDDIKTFAISCVHPMSLESYNPVPSFALDIALMPNGEKKIVEINTINSAGLYACDTDKFVMAMYNFEENND